VTVDAAHTENRRQNRARLATVDFSTYAAEGWPVALIGVGGSSRGLGQTIDHVKQVTVALPAPGDRALG
jgi:hypothetical protein